MASSTELYLPANLPYPIKIVTLAHSTQASIDRGTNLLNYSYLYVISSQEPLEMETRYGTWESPIAGVIESWKLRAGDVVSSRRANERPVLLVTEPCKHGIQLGGLCCLCGKDMTASDYTGFSDASRASIQMTHSANGPTVSFEEAQRIERETANTLLKSRKLSLIVDLDQTIVHATVDPTVGEWITEGELWEARQMQKKNKAAVDKDGEGSGSDDDNAVNPNWEALKDVKKFRLGPEAFGATQGRNRKGKERAIENDGVLYYVKPRPGWREFLSDIATKYEMHVYTMGTRAYAEEVCAAIDPDGKIFASRILSRDESGSLTQKSLQRLFPCDTSMVVIIDDRADVWEWSPNLVKVIPYDFFIGIGDINSAFLPKINPLAPSTPSSAPKAGTINDTDIKPAPSPASSETSDATLVDTESDEIMKGAMLTENSLALEAQVEARPLAKKQEELQATPTEPTPNIKAGTDTPPTSEAKAQAGQKRRNKAPTKALLRNDDVELRRVQNLLEEVHTRFYEAFDSYHPPKQKRPGKKRQEQEASLQLHDVKLIIPDLRFRTFDGVHMLFSSVIPLDAMPEATEIWKTATAFGATCHVELSNRVTHVVAAKRGTAKVDAARRLKGVKVVWLSWFTDSLSLWRHLDEAPYLMDDPLTHAVPISSSSPISDPHQISSDPEPDADDWDQETVKQATNPLELGTINWDDINDEVDAAMNESDSDEEGDARSDRSGMRSENVSEDDMSEDAASAISSAHSTPRTKRKRLRSLTPSEVGMNGNDDALRSPLAKRKKVAAERSGASKLKEAITATDLDEGAPLEIFGSRVGTPPPAERPTTKQQAEDDEDSDDAFDIDDDFLARELEEELG